MKIQAVSCLVCGWPVVLAEVMGGLGLRFYCSRCKLSIWGNTERSIKWLKSLEVELNVKKIP